MRLAREGIRFVEGTGIRFAEGDGMRFAEGDGMRFAEGDGMRFAEGDAMRLVEGDGMRFVDGDGMRFVEGDGMRLVGEEGMREAGGEGLPAPVREAIRRAGEREAGRGMPDDRGLGLALGRGGGGMRSVSSGEGEMGDGLVSCCGEAGVGVGDCGDVSLGVTRISWGVGVAGERGDVCSGSTKFGWGGGGDGCIGASTLRFGSILSKQAGGSMLKAGGGGGVIVKDGVGSCSVARASKDWVGMEVSGEIKLGTGSSLDAAVAFGVVCSSSLWCSSRPCTCFACCACCMWDWTLSASCSL